MNPRIPPCICLVLLVLLCLLPPAAGARTITASLGDDVNLRGSAPGLDIVYLFVTGPNLAPGGVRLENIRSPVISGSASSFTRADVIDDRWQYTWHTRTAGGVPDAGTYTVFVCERPLSRTDLRPDDFQTIAVSLGRPAVEATGGGAVLLISDPPGADVLLDGIRQGVTPVKLQNIPAGTYQIRLVKYGYEPVIETISVDDGAVLNLSRTLIALPFPGTPASPPPDTATSLPPSAPATTRAPVSGALVVVGAIFALMIAVRR